MGCSTDFHLAPAKRILRYIKGSIDYGIFYKNEGKSALVGYSDSDYAGDLDDRRSTYMYALC